jgi:hypothetical protein
MASVDISGNKVVALDKTPFWGNNPNVLFQKDDMFDFFPVDGMSFHQQVNAITRTVILLTIFTFAYTKSARILAVGAITLFAIYVYHYYKVKDDAKRVKHQIKETFDVAASPGLDVLSNVPGSGNDAAIFDAPTPANPFSNVMLTDYEYNPGKKPAPASFTDSGNAAILANAKKMVANANPTNPEIVDKLFTDLGEQFQFEQSLQPFVSAPATTIPNDQAAFAEFCYGSMVSCKEGNLFACARNLDRHTN